MITHSLPRPVRVLFSLVSLATVFALAGCSLLPEPKPDPTRYYVLTGPAESAPADAKASGACVLGLKRVELVSYLNGKDIVVREADNEIVYQRFARWAEPLSASIGRALVDTLSRSGKVGRVVAQPFPFDTRRDYDVSVRVLRCEGARRGSRGGASASFSAEVEITEAKPGGAVVARKTFTAPESTWDGEEFGKLARLLSDNVRALGEDLIASLPDR